MKFVTVLAAAAVASALARQASPTLGLVSRIAAF
jgi:hypothetical protein